MRLPLKNVLLVSIAITALDACAHNTQVMASSSQLCMAIPSDTAVRAQLSSGSEWWKYDWDKDGIALVNHAQGTLKGSPVDDTYRLLIEYSDVAIPADLTHYSLDQPLTLSPNGKYVLTVFRANNLPSAKVGLIDASPII